jgi:hypothetical protein
VLEMQRKSAAVSLCARSSGKECVIRDGGPKKDWHKWHIFMGDKDTDKNGEGRTRAEQLLHFGTLHPSAQAGSIPSRFDYVDIGHENRKDFMVPTGEDGSTDIRHPEPWQLRMLSIIKQRKSLVVVAPTSSGKTMSAEYAMRLVASSQDNGIGVFVLPTNALVVQTHGILSADPHIGQDKVAMFTKEDRVNIDKPFKVLVTNPQCLEILIMKKQPPGAPSDSFFSRLRYVVLDEIHCIGSTGSIEDADGAVLERLLCMLECPVVCLSATLANSNEFVDWLNSIRRGNDALAIEAAESKMEGSVVAGAGAGAVTVAASVGPSVEVVRHSERSTALHYHSLYFKKPQSRIVKRVRPEDGGGHLIEKERKHELLFQGGSTTMKGKWVMRPNEDCNSPADVIRVLNTQRLVIDYNCRFGDAEGVVTSLQQRQSSAVSGVNVRNVIYQ